MQHWRRARRTAERFRDPFNDPALAASDDDPLSNIADPAAPDPLGEILRHEEAAAIFALVEKLPLPQRSVLLLHVLEEFPLEEIARITAAPLGTVKSRLHHAKRALRALVEESTR